MDERVPDATPQLLSMLTTEHFALQGARGSAIADSSGRAALFLTSISSTLLALSLLSTATGLGHLFVALALAAALPLVYLGLVTFVHVLDSGLEDALYARGINRIRHYYLERAPELRPYFIQSDRDDMAGTLSNVGVSRAGERQALFTTAGLVGTINSVLLGWCTAGALSLIHGPLWALLLGGVGAFGAGAWLHLLEQRRAWARQDQSLDVRFPSARP